MQYNNKASIKLIYKYKGFYMNTFKYFIIFTSLTIKLNASDTGSLLPVSTKEKAVAACRQDLENTQRRAKELSHQHQTKRTSFPQGPFSEELIKAMAYADERKRSNSELKGPKTQFGL